MTREEHRKQLSEYNKISKSVMEQNRTERNAFGKTTRPLVFREVKSENLLLRVIETNFITIVKQTARLLVVKADNEEDIGKETEINGNSALYATLKKMFNYSTIGVLIIEGAYMGLSVKNNEISTQIQVTSIINEERRWPT